MDRDEPIDPKNISKSEVKKDLGQVLRKITRFIKQ